MGYQLRGTEGNVEGGGLRDSKDDASFGRGLEYRITYSFGGGQGHLEQNNKRARN